MAVIIGALTVFDGMQSKSRESLLNWVTVDPVGHDGVPFTVARAAAIIAGELLGRAVVIAARAAAGELPGGRAARAAVTVSTSVRVPQAARIAAATSVLPPDASQANDHRVHNQLTKVIQVQPPTILLKHHFSQQTFPNLRSNSSLFFEELYPIFIPIIVPLFHTDPEKDMERSAPNTTSMGAVIAAAVAHHVLSLRYRLSILYPVSQKNGLFITSPVPTIEEPE